MPLRNRSAGAGASTHTFNSSLPSPLEPLTPREEEVLGWIAPGKRNEEIGEILGLSHRTVEKHVQNIMRKLRVETRSAAGAWWHDRRHLAYLASLTDAGQAAFGQPRADGRGAT